MTPEKARRRAASSQGVSPLQRAVKFLFGLFFACMGAAMAWEMIGQPIARILEARGWEETTCTLESSEVQSTRSSDTHKIVVAYSYQVNGQVYSGSRYDFRAPGFTIGYDGKAEVVEALIPGTRIDCWADSEDPTRSVIDRDPGLFLLIGLISLPFLLVGIGLVISAWVNPGAKSRAAPGAPDAWRPTPRDEPPTRGEAAAAAVDKILGRHAAGSDGPVDASALGLEPDPRGGLALEPKTGRGARVLGLFFVALVWNGLIAVPLSRIGIFEGEIQDGCVALFLIPFVLVGIGLILTFLHQLLNLANPQPHLHLGSARPVPGAPATLEYRLSGATGRIGAFEIRLLGKETASYTRGTSSHTDTHTFFERTLVARDRVGGRLETLDFEWPKDAMPTFIASSNRIEWSLEVRGEILFWPDVEEKFPVPIYPPEARR